MTQPDFDAIVVGAGFAGLYMLHRLRSQGLRVRVIEAASDVGGTWYWNRYPGARCDVESMQYSYQFSDELQQEWDWTERYATQPEILRYAQYVAVRFDLCRDITFKTRVVAATFDEAATIWRLETDMGETLSARFCIMATGCLSVPSIPDIEGVDSFVGNTYHTGLWPHEEVGFSGQQVGVIGTGSSGIQAIPIIAEEAEHLFVFQRSAHYTVPAHNAPLAPEAQREVKARYGEIRECARSLPSGVLFPLNNTSAMVTSAEDRQQEYEKRWRTGGVGFLGAFNDLMFDAEANETAASFVREKVRETLHDPDVAELLMPHGVIGCRRLCVDTGFHATFNRDNVTLVNVRETPIERIYTDGMVVGTKIYALDAIVFATGFDAMTGALLKIDIRGSGGCSLRDKWAEGPRAYLGLTLAGFPNLFTITGPGSPSVFTNMIPSIEQHVVWIADCIAHLRENGFSRIEATEDAEDAWIAHVADVASHHLRASCGSWYLGANIPGKPRVFMPYIGGFPTYVQKCDEIVAKGYVGFALSA